MAIIQFFSGPDLRASFSPLSVGARAAGMADAFTMVADDALSLYYNPAGVVHVRRPELSTYYSRLFMGLDDKSELNRAFMGYVQPLPGSYGRLGLSYVSLGLPGLYSETAIGLTYGREVQSKWNVGGTLKFLRKSFGSDAYTDNAINVDTGFALGGKDPLLAKGQSKSALALDLGAQYRFSHHYALGLALRNLNQPQMGLGDGSDKVPAVYTVGLGRWTRVSSLSLELSNGRFAADQDYRLHLGGERWFRSGAGLRAGLAAGTREYRNAAVGGSYRMDGFQFDYALNYPLQGVEKTAGSHMVSLTFRFGKPAPDPIEASLEAEREARLRAESEMVRLRAQLMELTASRPVPPADMAAPEVDSAAQDALKQAQEELERLKEPAPSPELPPPAVSVPPPAAPVRPARPRISPDLLSQYSEDLKAYSQQVKAGAAVGDRSATLKRLLDKYSGSGVDTSALRSELRKLQEGGGKVQEEYKLSLSYYRKIAQQGTGAEERIILLERIVKKYKPMGVDTSECEKELDNLRKER